MELKLITTLAVVVCTLATPALAGAQQNGDPDAWSEDTSATYDYGSGDYEDAEYVDQDGSTTYAPLPPLVPLPPVAPVPLRPVQPIQQVPTIAPTRTVPGKVAKLRSDGKAAVPAGAPVKVRTLIRAANAIVGKPYKWGGGHAKLLDKGYDCSGTVSYALIGAGLLSSPMVSGSFSKWSAAGRGRWITTYSTRNHIYMEVAGLRLDTSAVGDPRGESGPRWRPLIGKRPRFHTRHPRGY